MMTASAYESPPHAPEERPIAGALFFIRDGWRARESARPAVVRGPSNAMAGAATAVGAAVVTGAVRGGGTIGDETAGEVGATIGAVMGTGVELLAIGAVMGTGVELLAAGRVELPAAAMLARTDAGGGGATATPGDGTPVALKTMVETTDTGSSAAGMVEGTVASIMADVWLPGRASAQATDDTESA